MHLSVVVPAYNEASSLENVLGKALSYLDKQSFDAEIIVVDDGSSDETYDIAHAFTEHHPTRVSTIRLSKNLGKGGATRTGMLEHATGDYRVFYDADGSTPIEEIEKLWPLFESGTDVVIGSRALDTSNIINHQPWYRETMGRTFNLLLRLLFLTPYKDTQCGFKAFTAEASEILFSHQHIERFSFDVELLYTAHRHKMRIKEIPIEWHNIDQSSLHPITDSLQMLIDILKIRWRALRGHYN